MMACQEAIPVAEISQVGEARRRCSRIATNAGLSEESRGKASIIVTELATNLANYGTGGEILVRSSAHGGRKGLEILSIDRGPGMDLARCRQDGYSSGGTKGNGIGAVERLSTTFDAFSAEPGGTVILSRILDSAPGGDVPEPFAWGVVNRPVAGEERCGDSWTLAGEPGRFAIMLADGLGHGILAAEASDLAVKAFDEAPFDDLPAFIERADRRLQGSRGAAVAVASIDLNRSRLSFAGVGNISGSLRGEDGLGKGLVSHNGTAGVQLRKVQQFEYDCPPRGLLIMHTDGLQSRWALEKYLGLARRHPAVIAGVLYRDFTRGRDDVTVAVVQLSFG